MMETQMIKESYERSELAITMFSEEDVIVTSGNPDTFLDDLGNLFPGDNQTGPGADPNAAPNSWGT